MNSANGLKASAKISFRRIFQKIILLISKGAWIPSTQRYKLLRLGGVRIKKSFIGEGCIFDTIRPDLINIEEGCVITARTIILSHYINPDGGMFYGEVNIGKRVFIGVNSVILGPKNIGDGALIGAGSVVTKDVPSKQVWAGNPAKFIKEREISL